MSQIKKQADRRQQSRGLPRTQKGIADWMGADAALVMLAIERASFVGGALRFGYSRDGGAYAVGIYGDGDPYTEFCKPSEDLDEFLREIITLYEIIADDQEKARGAKKKPPQGDEDLPV